MREKTNLKKVLAFLLCAAMIITYMPSSALTFADETADEPVIVQEDPTPAPAVEKTVDAPADEPVISGDSDSEPADVQEPAEEEGDDADSGDEAEDADIIDQETPEDPEAVPEETEEEPAEETKEYPAVTLSENVGGVTVTLIAPEGALPAGADLRVSKVTRQDVFEAVSEKIAAEGKEMTDAVAFDVTPVDKDGNPVQPNRSVSVTFSGTGLESGNGGVDVFRVSDNASSVTEMSTSVATVNKQTFSTGHFTIYVATGSASDPNGDGSGPNSRSNPYVLAYGESIQLRSNESGWITSGTWSIPDSTDRGYASQSNGLVTNRNTSTSEPVIEVEHRWNVVNTESFYIKLLRQPYKVTFEVQDAGQTEWSTYTATVFKGDYASAPGEITPTQEYGGKTYTFEGWYTEVACKNKVNLDEVQILANRTFYAKYGAESTIHYDRNTTDSASVPADQTGMSGTSVTIGTARRSGYALHSWNTARDGSGTSYTAGADYPMPEGNITLYAQWDETTITIIYHGTNWSDDEANQAASQNSRVTLNSKTLERNNSVFLGWAVASGRDEPNYYPGQTIETGSTDINLYPVWGTSAHDYLNYDSLTAKGTTLTYDGKSHEIKGVQEGEGENGYLYIGQASFLGILPIPFVDVYADISGIEAQGVDAGSYATPCAVHLYYVNPLFGPHDKFLLFDYYLEVTNNVLTIEPAEVEISTDSATRAYIEGEALTAGGSGKFTKGGDGAEFTFTHDGDTVSLINGETLNIRTTGSQTEVGESENGIEVDWGKPSWSDAESTAKSHNYIIKEGTIGTLEVTEEGVQISYRANPSQGGSVSPASESVKGDAAAAGSTATANPGYEFVNWTDADGAVKSTEAAFVPARGTDGKYEAATYTANFEESEITITYTAEGHGSVSKTSETAGAVDTAASEVEGSTAAAETGYEFDGWYVGTTKISDAAEAITPAQVVANLTEAGSTADYTYYRNTEFTAKFKPIEYTITYDLGPGTVEGTNPTSYTIESDAITLINPTSDKYTFLGWTGTGLSGDTMEVTIPKGSTGNREYKAEWQFTVTYHTNYSETATDNPKTVTGRLGSSITVQSFQRVYDFQPTGVVFDGWATSASGGPAYQSGASIRDNADLYAVWIKTGIPQAAATITYTAKLEDGTAGGGSVNIPSETLDGHWASWPWIGGITYDDPTPCTATPDTNYEFVGWYKGDTLVSQNPTLTKQDILNNMNTGTWRYWFDIFGWLEKDIYKDTDFVAKFKPVTFDVTYVISEESDSPSGYVPPEGKTEVEVGEEVTVEPDATTTETTKDGVPGTWTFEGWTAPEGVTVEDGKFAMPAKNVEFTGAWTFVADTYTVTWVNEDGTVLEKDDGVAYNANPSYDGATPTKAADASNTYTFDKWTPDQAPVTADVTYTATFTATPIPVTPEDNPTGGGGGTTPTTTTGDGGAAAATAAAAADGDGTDIVDEPTPQAEPETIEDEATPEALPERAWALLNVIAAVLTALGAVYALFRKKEEDDDDEDSSSSGKATAAKVAGIALAIGAIVAVILTEDLTATMQLTDKWTALMAALLAGEAVAGGLTRKFTK